VWNPCKTTVCEPSWKAHLELFFQYLIRWDIEVPTAIINMGLCFTIFYNFDLGYFVFDRMRILSVCRSVDDITKYCRQKVKIPLTKTLWFLVKHSGMWHPICLQGLFFLIRRICLVGYQNFGVVHIIFGLTLSAFLSSVFSAF
jgi:hypothetical protein